MSLKERNRMRDGYSQILTNGVVKGNYVRLNDITFRIMSQHEDTMDLYYSGTYIPNVPKKDIANNAVPMADVLKHVGEELNGKVISSMQSMNDVEVTFPDGTTQAGYKYKDIASIQKPMIAPEPVIIEEDESKSRGYSSPYLMANGRPFVVDMTSFNSGNNSVTIKFMDGLKEVKCISREMLCLLYYTNDGVRRFPEKTVMKMQCGLYCYVDTIEDNGIFANVFLMDKEKKNKWFINHVWYKDFLRRQVTKDYETEGYGYRKSISLVGAHMMLKSGTSGTVDYIAPNGDMVFITDEGKELVTLSQAQLRGVADGDKIEVGYSNYSHGGEFYRVLSGEKDSWNVWSYRYKKWHTGVKDIEILSGKFGEQLTDHTGEHFRNIQGVLFTILNTGKEFSVTGDSEVHMMSEHGEHVVGSIYSAINGVICERGYNMDFVRVGSREVPCFGNIAYPQYANYDDAIKQPIFYGTSLVDGKTFYGTKAGMEMYKQGKEIQPKYVPEGLTVKVGTRRLQKCGMTAVVVGGINDDNLAVQFEDKTILYNVSKADLESKKLVPINENMIYYLKGYEQSDGGMVYVLNTDGTRCNIFIKDTGMEIKDVNLDTVVSGDIRTKIDTSVEYENSIGMKYTISIDNKDIICKFEDGSIVSSPMMSFNPESVYPDYIYIDGDSVNIGNIIHIRVVELQRGKYIFNGVCRNCKVEVKGTYMEMFMHRCK